MKYLSLFLLFTLFGSQVIAAPIDSDLELGSKNMFFSTDTPIVNQNIRVYATIKNNSEKDLFGYVRFYDEKLKKQIGKDEEVSIIGGTSDDVFVDWVIIGYGNHPISARIVPQISSGDDISNNKVTKNIFVDYDSDGDGIPDRLDNDDDNDGIIDADDLFPHNSREWLDTDKDSLGNNTDDDDDNDGTKDKDDAFPLDETEWLDTDNDLIGNNTDDDDDADGLKDNEESDIGTNPIMYDTDLDGVNDKDDAFPLDSQRSVDTDNDGLTDFDDEDDDNDGTRDKDDAFPLDETEWLDTDNDLIGNNTDDDDDNDGLPDAREEIIGTDTLKQDTDEDGFNDPDDAFPLDNTEWTDCDNDGIGNNKDTDDDNDGKLDSKDLFPCDIEESGDCDNDGIGNNKDTDDDNDGRLDGNDLFPCDSNEWEDSDSDGVGNNADQFDNNKAPVPEIYIDSKDGIRTGVKILFSAKNSHDVDGKVKKIKWMIDNDQFNGEEVTYVFKKPGKHKIGLEVIDDIGEVSNKSIDIFVEKSFPIYLIPIFAVVLILLTLIFFSFVNYKIKHPFSASHIEKKLRKKTRQEEEIIFYLVVLSLVFFTMIQ